MVFPNPTGRVKTQELENRPTEAALRVAAKVALLDGQTEYEFVWPEEGTAQKFMIKLRRSESDSKLIDWSFYQDAEPEALELWTLTGSDIADVYSKVVFSTDVKENAENSRNGTGSEHHPTPEPEIITAQVSPENPGSNSGTVSSTGNPSVETPTAPKPEVPAPPTASPFGHLIRHAAKVVRSTEETIPPAISPISIPTTAAAAPESSAPAAEPEKSASLPAETHSDTPPADQATPLPKISPLHPEAVSPPSVPEPEASPLPPSAPEPETAPPSAPESEAVPLSLSTPESEAAPPSAPESEAVPLSLSTPEPQTAPPSVPEPEASPLSLSTPEPETAPPSAPEPEAAPPPPAMPETAKPETILSSASPSKPEMVETSPPKPEKIAGAIPPSSPEKHSVAMSSEPDEALEGNPLSWEEQCRTFDGANSLPIIEVDRLSRVEEPGELEGDLSQTNIADVLRIISYDVQSGRLSIDSKQKQADIFFFEGQPIHATGSMGEGMEGMLRVIGLEEGHYRFDKRMTTDQRTVELPLEVVIFQGIQLAEDTKFLTELHLTSDSVLVRRNQYLSEKGFEALLINGEPIDLNLQKSVYLAVDGQTSLKEIVRRLGLTRTQWVPVVTNMIRCKVIAPKQVKASAKVNVMPKAIAPELLATVTSKLNDDESKILTLPALLFMLEHETKRADIDHPLSFLLLEVGEAQSLSGSSHGIPDWALNRIVFLMSGFKRRTDVFGHYEKHNEFALIMPDVKPSVVLDYTKDWVERIISDSVIRDIANNLKFNFGVASMPEDANNVPLLLSAAELAKKHSISSGSQIVLAQNLEAVQASRNTPLAPR